jgi:hypothetical protein
MKTIEQLAALERLWKIVNGYLLWAMPDRRQVPAGAL